MLLALWLLAEVAVISAYIVAAVVVRTIPNPRNAALTMMVATFAVGMVSLSSGLSLSAASVGVVVLRKIYFSRQRSAARA